MRNIRGQVANISTLHIENGSTTWYFFLFLVHTYTSSHHIQSSYTIISSATLTHAGCATYNVSAFVQSVCRKVAANNRNVSIHIYNCWFKLTAFDSDIFLRMIAHLNWINKINTIGCSAAPIPTQHPLTALLMIMAYYIFFSKNCVL